jgi:DNA-binding CsgD family transcriptional regulator
LAFGWPYLGIPCPIRTALPFPFRATFVTKVAQLVGVNMFSNLIRVVLVIQILCALVFVSEFIGEVFGLKLLNLPWRWHEYIEISAVLGLLIGMGVTIYTLHSTLRRNQKVEDQLLLASGEFETLLNLKFKQWSLTGAETEVARLIIKGFSTSEIASYRGKSEGTIKAQSAAVYKKSGVGGRTQLLVSFVEDMVDQAIEANEK